MNERVERLITVLAFIAAGTALAFGGMDTLAAAALGTAGGYAMPRVPPGPALALGLGCMVAATLNGCTPADVALAHKWTCDAIAVAHVACEATSGGSSP